MSRNLIHAALVCLARAANLSLVAQEAPATQPEAVGLSSKRLERIGTAVQRGSEDKRIAGAVTLVYRHGSAAL